MVEFNCTVKDIFRRPNMIDKAVRELADKGYAEHAVTYTRLRDNIFNALAYTAGRMKDYEYDQVFRAVSCEDDILYPQDYKTLCSQGM